MEIRKYDGVGVGARVEICISGHICTTLHLQQPSIGQVAAQVPQASTPDTWLLFSSVLVEHHGLYPPLVVQAVWETPLNLNGKTHSALPPGPTALQSVDLEQKVRKTGLTMVEIP